MSAGSIRGDAGVMPRNISQLLELFRRLAGSTDRMPARLIDCERCGSAFVNPTSWDEQGEADWWIRLRCGECGLVRAVEVTQDEAERFEADLDRTAGTIAMSLERLERARLIADALPASPGRAFFDPGDFRR